MPREPSAVLHLAVIWLPLCIISFQVKFLHAAEEGLMSQWLPKVLLRPFGFIDHGGTSVHSAVQLSTLQTEVSRTTWISS